MQIKRFEGPDMTETLRLVKEEFGDNAVILSAKQIRPGGFFKKMRKKCVEVTAAIDTETGDNKKNDQFSGVLSKQLNDIASGDRVTLASKRQYDASKMKDADCLDKQTNRLNAEENKEKTDADKPFIQKVKEESSSHGIQKKFDSRHPSKAAKESYFSAGYTHQIARPFYHQMNRQKRVAMVGPCGSGKSTTIAKLALHCKQVEKVTVAMISLDRFSIGANSLIDAVSKRMDIPFTVVYNDKQLQDTLGGMTDIDVILIDTPGLSKSDETKSQAVSHLIHQAMAEEIHWVANVTTRKENHLADAKLFLEMNVTHLLFTRVEEVSENGFLLDLMMEVGLPLEFYSDGTDLFNHLNEVDLKWMKEWTRPEASGSELDGGAMEKVIKWTRPQLVEDFGSLKKTYEKKETPVVVNGNSELFHDPECKSVKNLDPASINVLNSIETALEMGLKPCQICSRPLSMEKDERKTVVTRQANAT